MLQKIIKFVKSELVLVVSSVFALLSMLLVPPTANYYSYINFTVLGILFSLMAVVAGFVKTGLFDYLSSKMLAKSNDVKIISIILVNCVFFTAMFVTNDVALIAFVPVTIWILRPVGQARLIMVVVMQTIAANIGSMLTPIGNPQNLYIYTFYHLHILDFFKIVAPLTLIGYILIIFVMLRVKSEKIPTPVTEPQPIRNKGALSVYFVLFLICILTVLHIIDHRVCFGVVALTVFIIDREILKKVDYSLLLTFVAFFIFAGNISNIHVVHSVLSTFLDDKVFILTVLISQIISNVPAAVMLSGFTNDVTNLLLGVNIGSLGTLVASLASLISFRIYGKNDGAKLKKYFLVFTVYNFAILVILRGIVLLID